MLLSCSICHFSSLMGVVVFCKNENTQVLTVERKLGEGVGIEGGRQHLNSGDRVFVMEDFPPV